ncbi:unnamed protein product [Prorocentrum cordatum]|uniref:Exocyst complex component Sec6 n=1 Tax=Prorocentrum cordatum TaxID=2364126 RepID=A0ABN9XJY0_9DINO|nr:unnamed protein product [Polarella glacialis]
MGRPVTGLEGFKRFPGSRDHMDVAESLQAVTKKPGYEEWDYDECMAENDGKIQTQKGHYKSVDSGGAKVVIVPDKKFKRVEFNSVQSVNKKIKLGQVADEGGNVDTRMRAIADSFVPDFGGTFLQGDAVGAVLAASDGDPATSPPTSARAKGAGSSGSTLGARLAPQQADDGGPPAIAGGGPSNAAAAKPKAKPKGKANQGQGPRGRPKKPLVQKVEEYEEQFSSSLPTDAGWWGSEVKSILGSLRDIAKDIDNRLKKEPDSEEIDTLTIARKKLTAIMAIVEQASKTSLDDDSFKDTDDMTVTKLQLEPTATLQFPPRVSYARHKFDIRSVSSIDAWLVQVSSASLRKAGLANVSEEQERLWSECMSTILKMKGADMNSTFDEFFAEDRDFDLEDDAMSFLTAFGVCWCMFSYVDLDLLVELGKEAVDALDEAAKPTTGTQLGGALMGLPKGRKLLESFRAHVAKAEHTQGIIASLAAPMNKFKETADAALPHIGATNVASLGELRAALLELRSDFEAKVPLCLASFKPDFSKGERCEHFLHLASSVRLALVDVLKPVMSGGATLETLATWVEQPSASRNRMLDLTSTLVQCKVVFGSSADLTACGFFLKLIECMVECGATITKQDATIEGAQKMQKNFEAVFRSSNDAVGEEFKKSMQDLASSPLFSPDGAFHQKIASCLHAHGRPIVQALADEVQKIFKEFPLDNSSLAGADAQKAAALADSVLPDPIVNNVVKWAASCGDPVLLQQALYLSNSHAFAKSLAAARVLGEAVLNHAKIDKRAITQAQVNVLKDTRARHAGFEAFLKENAKQLCDCESVDVASHIPILKQFVNPKALGPVLLEQSLTIQSRFAETWTKDLESLCEQVEASCPNYAPVRESLLSNDVMIETLTNNPKYGGIGKLTSLMKEYRRLVKVLHADRQPALISAEVTKKTKELIDLGVETVAFTFFIWKVKVAWKDVVNPTLAKKNVEQLRLELKPSGVTLTQQMEDYLKAWGDGVAPSDAVADRDGTAKARWRAEGQANGDSTSGPPAAAGAAPPAEAAVGKKKSLAERAKEARAKRIRAA